MFRTTSKRTLAAVLTLVIMISLLPFCITFADDETLSADMYAASESAAVSNAAADTLLPGAGSLVGVIRDLINKIPSPFDLVKPKTTDTRTLIG